VAEAAQSSGEDSSRPEQGEGPWFHGDEPGAVDAAFAEATGSDRKVLIDFYARWCPPCDRLRDEFLELPEHGELLDSFVLLKLDADDPHSFELKERYRVGGYPTLLVVDGEGRELQRFVGYDSDAERLAQRLASLRSALPLDQLAADAPLAERLTRLVAADRGEEARELLASIATGAAEHFAGDYEGLVLALELVPAEQAAAVAEAAAELAPGAGAAAQLASRAAKALEEQGDPAAAAALRLRFEEQLEASIRARSPVDAIPGRGWASLSGQVPVHEPGLHDELAGAAWYRAGWAGEERKQALLAEGAARIAAAMLLSEAEHAPELPLLEDGRLSVVVPDHLLTEAFVPRLAAQTGRVHDLLSFLQRAGLPDAAAALYQAMVELFPEDFTWHYRRSGFYEHIGDLERAVASARLSLRWSYGDNRLRAAGRLAEQLHRSGATDEALEVVTEALAAPPPSQPNVRTHRYRAALSEKRDSWTESEPR